MLLSLFQTQGGPRKNDVKDYNFVSFTFFDGKLLMFTDLVTLNLLNLVYITKGLYIYFTTLKLHILTFTSLEISLLIHGFFICFYILCIKQNI